MKKLVYIIPIVLGGLVSDAYSHNLRQAAVTIDGISYEVWINQESEDAGSYQVAPGATECHTGDIIIEYFDDMSMKTARSICIQGIACFPGNAECFDGSTTVKMCSEYTFSCVTIDIGPMESFDGYSDTFACIQGYYKDKMSCNRCPSSGGVYGTTKSSGATSITECYIPSGTDFSDSSGTWEYDQNCYYSK
ncbi:MAG: hypothetical protein IJD41_02030 [Alphaproteobacteria bacterium]|nr:hypothetical protein [Alphaproteobacteria bacterium]